MTNLKQLQDNFRETINSLEKDRLSLVAALKKYPPSNNKNKEATPNVGKNAQTFLVAAIVCTVVWVLSILSGSGSMLFLFFFISGGLWVGYFIERNKEGKTTSGFQVHPKISQATKKFKGMVYDELLKPLMQEAHPNADFMYRINSKDKGYFEQYKTNPILNQEFSSNNRIFHLRENSNPIKATELSVCAASDSNQHQLFVSFPYPQEVKATTCIATSNELFTNLQMLGEKKVLADEKFNSTFEVYSDNELHAYEVMTPEMMDLLAKIEEKYEEGIVMIFDGETMQFAMDYKPDRFRNITSKETIEDRFKEFYKGCHETRDLLRSFRQLQ